MDNRENRSNGGSSSLNAPTVTCWRFSHLARDTWVHSAGDWLDERRVRSGTIKKKTCRR